MDTIKIKNRELSNQNPTMIIMEIGANHNGSLELGKELIQAAYENGADGVKFQTYKTEKRFAPDNPFIEDFKKFEFSHEQEKQLWNFARSMSDDFIVMSTPFDDESTIFCKEMNSDALKIASFEVSNLPLVTEVAKAGLPVVFSVGTCSFNEIDAVVRICREQNVDFLPLHCISSYPTPIDKANLRAIHSLSKRYQCLVGFSDHTTDSKAAELAVAAGACFIEKHFTLDQSLEGPDHSFSITPQILKELVQRIRNVEEVMGTGEVGPKEVEKFIIDNCKRVVSAAN